MLARRRPATVYVTVPVTVHVTRVVTRIVKYVTVPARRAPVRVSRAPRRVRIGVWRGAPKQVRRP